VACHHGTASNEPVGAQSGARHHDKFPRDSVHPPGMSDTAVAHQNEAVTGEADPTGVVMASR
jgi:hypothetical protein